MSNLTIRLQLWCLAVSTGVLPEPLLPTWPRDRDRDDRDRGQATTEYALVMLGAAAVALLVITWATAGGGAGKIGRLFDRVIDAIIDKM
jgi:hypothetical protein